MSFRARPRSAFLAAVFSIALIAACNSAQTEPRKLPTISDGDWQMSSVARLKVELPMGKNREIKSVSLDVRVFVDSSGHPDMGTLRVLGPGAAENRAMITEWVREATYVPSTKNTAGHPGYFHHRLDVNFP